MEALFIVISLIALASAMGVIIYRQPLYSAFCLVTNLCALAALYAMMEASFLSAVQIIVYAGAIVVLIVFVIMLLSIHGSERHPFGPFLTIFGVVSTATFLYVLVPLLRERFAVYSDPFQAKGSVANFAMILYHDYVFAFEAASLLIMAAIVGAVMLARRTSSTSGLKQGGVE